MMAEAEGGTSVWLFCGVQSGYYIQSQRRLKTAWMHGAKEKDENDSSPVHLDTGYLMWWLG